MAVAVKTWPDRGVTFLRYCCRVESRDTNQGIYRIKYLFRYLPIHNRTAVLEPHY